MEGTVQSILRNLSAADFGKLLWLGLVRPFTAEFAGTGIYKLLFAVIPFMALLYAVYRLRLRWKPWLFPLFYGVLSSLTLTPILILFLYQSRLLDSMSWILSETPLSMSELGYINYTFYLSVDILFYFFCFLTINLAASALFAALAETAHAAVLRLRAAGRTRVREKPGPQAPMGPAPVLPGAAHKL